MKLRTTFLTVLTLLAFILGSAVQAQDACFGLPSDDCDVINEASANGIGDAESFTMTMSIDFTADGLGAIGDLVGSFSGDPSAAGDVPEEIAFGFEAEMDVAVDEDSELGAYMNGTMTISFSADGEGDEQTVDVMLVDDVVYINDGTGWLSIDLIEVMEDEELGALFGDMAGDGDPTEAMDDLGIDPDAFGGLVGIMALDGFLNYERDGDDFVFTIDFGALQTLLDEENEDLLNEIVESAAEVDPSMALFVPLIPTLISDGDIVITQTVDTDANIVTDIVVESELELALGMLAGSTEVTTTDLTVEIGLDNLDGVDMEDAPEEALDFTAFFIEILKSSMNQ